MIRVHADLLVESFEFLFLLIELLATLLNHLDIPSQDASNLLNGLALLFRKLIS